MAVDDLFEVVTPTPRVPPAGPTLLRTANRVIPVDDRWQRGMKWWPEACGAVDSAIATAYCGTSKPEFALSTHFGQEGVSSYVPLFVQVAQKCSAIGGQNIIDEVRARAIRLLNLSETAAIARELWRGDIAKGENPDLPNDYLANSATYTDVGSGATLTVTNALAQLEAKLATCAAAGGNLIHASPFLTTLWAQNHLLERLPDGRLVTYLGTGVVADPGYDGSAFGGATAATTSWAYGTGPVDVRLGAVEVLDVLNQIRPINDYTVYAYRPFAATFDPCCHLAVKVDHTHLT